MEFYFSARALGVGIAGKSGDKKTRFRLKIKRQKRGSCGTTPIAGRSGHSAASAIMHRECAAHDNGRLPVPPTQPKPSANSSGMIFPPDRIAASHHPAVL